VLARMGALGLNEEGTVVAVGTVVPRTEALLWSRGGVMAVEVGIAVALVEPPVHSREEGMVAGVEIVATQAVRSREVATVVEAETAVRAAADRVAATTTRGGSSTSLTRRSCPGTRSSRSRSKSLCSAASTRASS
jgi:hypothetical protein